MIVSHADIAKKFAAAHTQHQSTLNITLDSLTSAKSNSNKPYQVSAQKSSAAIKGVKNNLSDQISAVLFANRVSQPSKPAPAAKAAPTQNTSSAANPAPAPAAAPINTTSRKI